MRSLTGIVAAAMLTVAASLTAQAQNADWDKVVAAAKAEGSLTFYASFSGDKNQLALVKKFEDETGIKVSLLDVRQSEMEQRIQAEAAAGKVVADVILNSIDTVDANAATGVIGPMGAVPNVASLKPDLKATDTRMPIYMTASGILVNTALLPAGERPKRWKDLLDPKYKGKILADDFRAQGAGFIWFQSTLSKLGKDFHVALFGQNITFSRQQAEDQLRVARGEFLIKVPQNLSIYKNSIADKGLPVAMVFPEEGATYAVVALGVPKGAPHPNAARVLINWYLSQPTQVAFTNMGQIPGIVGLADKVEGDNKATATMKLFGTTNLKSRDADLELAKEIFKQ